MTSRLLTIEDRKGLLQFALILGLFLPAAMHLGCVDPSNQFWRNYMRNSAGDAFTIHHIEVAGRRSRLRKISFLAAHSPPRRSVILSGAQRRRRTPKNQAPPPSFTLFDQKAQSTRTQSGSIRLLRLHFGGHRCPADVVPGKWSFRPHLFHADLADPPVCYPVVDPNTLGHVPVPSKLPRLAHAFTGRLILPVAKRRIALSTCIHKQPTAVFNGRIHTSILLAHNRA